MDCGEGTFGQLVRHFGAARADEILANTNLIFVSHMHLDHHLGLIMLLKRRRDAVRMLGSKCPKVYLLAPHTMQLWLYNYQQRFEDIYDCIEFVPNDLIVSVST